MYLTAHHVVRSPEQEGVNVFRHWHGPGFNWPREAAGLPDTNPGKLDREVSRITVEPGGNRVRAYVDVLAPDDTSKSTIIEALQALVGDLDERRNPTVFVFGPVTVRFGVELSLEQTRRVKLQEFIAALEPLMPN